MPRRRAGDDVHDGIALVAASVPGAAALVIGGAVDDHRRAGAGDGCHGIHRGRPHRNPRNECPAAAVVVAVPVVVGVAVPLPLR